MAFCFHLTMHSAFFVKIDGFIDPLIRSMEVAIVPELQSLGCDLLNCLAERYIYSIYDVSFILTKDQISPLYGPSFNEVTYYIGFSTRTKT